MRQREDEGLMYGQDIALPLCRAIEEGDGQGAWIIAEVRTKEEIKRAITIDVLPLEVRFAFDINRIQDFEIERMAEIEGGMLWGGGV